MRRDFCSQDTFGRQEAFLTVTNRESLLASASWWPGIVLNTSLHMAVPSSSFQHMQHRIAWLKRLRNPDTKLGWVVYSRAHCWSDGEDKGYVPLNSDSSMTD